ncbi:DNA-processing protein DprA [Clostridium sp. CTA-19]
MYDKYKIWLAIAPIKNSIKLELLKELKNEKNIYNFMKENSNRKNRLVETLLRTYSEERLYNLQELCEREGISFLNIKDAKYPKSLLNINEMPYGLFYKGNIDKLNNNDKKIAIVGSRRASYYGKNIVEIICRELKDTNVQIISGLARGIDGEAHKGSIENGIYTCGVLGCGIDVIYPKEHKNLYKKIIENQGCILSEFSPDAPPERFRFPLRNRIISGLSNLIIIVEASEKSGSLITANWALEQGKDIMAVPASIFLEQNKGTNKLIKDGAYPFTSVEDIINLLEIEKTYNANKNVRKSYSEICDRIYEILTSEPMHVDEIARSSNIDITQLYGVLFEMQLREEICCLNGNYYVKVNKSI